MKQKIYDLSNDPRFPGIYVDSESAPVMTRTISVNGDCLTIPVIRNSSLYKYVVKGESK